MNYNPTKEEISFVNNALAKFNFDKAFKFTVISLSEPNWYSVAQESQ
ncbi:MAG: hypothetical protein WCR31_11175 [Treponema sp.]